MAYYTLATTGAETDERLAAVPELQTEVGTLQDAIDALQSDLSTAQTQLDTLQAELQTAQSELTSVQSELADTQEALSTAQATIDALPTDYKKWRCVIAGAKNDVSAPYYKVADTTATSTYGVRLLTLKVNCEFGVPVRGILNAYFRGGSTAGGEPSFIGLYWEYLSGSVTLDQFFLAYKSTDAGLVVELWFKATKTYETAQFYVLNEASDYITASQDAWTLYSTIGTGETEIDDSYTIVSSTLATIRNPVNSDT